MSQRILLVDDDAGTRDTLRDILVDRGFSVLTASDGAEALAALQVSIPDLVISDINMPRMDGYHLYEAVRDRPEWAHLPFIFLTGLGERDEVRQGKLLGVDDYLVKPLDEEDLLVAVRGVIERHERVKRASEREVSDLKKTLVTVLNHEILTPLTALVGCADLLRESGGQMGPEALRDFLNGILAGSERLSRLAGDFRLLVDIESGTLGNAFDRHCEPITDLPALLRGVLDAARDTAMARGVRLVAEIPKELPGVLGRPDLLRAALGHVLGNAIKFSRKDTGRAVLAARAGAGHVTIEVSDSGIGIPADELARVTEMFYQWDRARREQQGTGSGLFIAQSIAALHGGRLSIRSEVDKGTTVTLELPVQEGPPSPQ